MVVLVLALAAGAAVTYQMEIWGGHTVPNVVGKSEADATYELERKGFAVRWTQVKSDDVEGKVLLTRPVGRLAQGGGHRGGHPRVGGANGALGGGRDQGRKRPPCSRPRSSPTWSTRP